MFYSKVEQVSVRWNYKSGTTRELFFVEFLLRFDLFVFIFDVANGIGGIGCRTG